MFSVKATTKKPFDEMLDSIRKEQRFLLVCAAGVFVLVFGFYVYHFHDGFSPKTDAWGQFGDYFGGILNPVFAFLGFFALLKTITLQCAELDEASKQTRKSQTCTAYTGIPYSC